MRKHRHRHDQRYQYVGMMKWREMTMTKRVACGGIASTEKKTAWRSKNVGAYQRALENGVVIRRNQKNQRRGVISIIGEEEIKA